MNILHEIGTRVAEGANAPNLAFFILTMALIVAPLISAKLRLPAMVGLVLIGMAVGPHGFKVLKSESISLKALGEFGLLYLMFSAGLELDLKELARRKKAALTFAVLSFIIPFTLGLVSAKFLLGYAMAAAVLMGSNWGSHTLVTYPMLRKMGLAQNRGVSTVVGATAVTDTSALLVLSAVSVSTQRNASFLAEGAEVFIGLVVIVLWSFFVLPKLGRWYFRAVGADEGLRMVFGFAAFFFGALLAEAAGIDGIVGAFFAGLGLSRAIPEQSTLMDRLQFFGASVFIPVFLVSVGILLDPKVMIDPKTLLYALVFTVAVLGGKSLAAIVVGKIFGYKGTEIGVMSGLSGSQAAATLATTLVGQRLGLFDSLTINAVLVVILVSLVITPALVSHFGKKLAAGDIHRVIPLGDTVLVPVWGERTRPLLELAGRLAGPDNGIVLGATFATESAPDEEIEEKRSLSKQAVTWLAQQGLESRSVFRISRSVPAGLTQTMRAEDATLVVSEWSENIGTDKQVLEFLTQTPNPALFASGPVESFDRLLLVARPQEMKDRRDLDLATEIASRLIHKQHVAVVGARLEAGKALFESKKVHVESIETSDPLAWVASNMGDRDLVLLPGLDLVQEAQRRFPDALQKRLLVAIAPRQVRVPRPDPEREAYPTLHPPVGRGLRHAH